MQFSPITFIGKHSPYYYSSFVSTIDGKVMVKKEGYWPLGSEYDLQHFIHLRTYADVIIDGKQTALGFADRTIMRIHDESFNTQRIQNGKQQKAEYMIITSSPDDSLISAITNEYEYKPFLVTSLDALLSKELEALVRVIRLPLNQQGHIHLLALHNYLSQQGFKTIFIDGGAVLLASFFEYHLLDELFLTITPKIVGSEKETTISLVEGKLFSPADIKHAKLISVQQIEDEVILRYHFQK